MPRNITVTFADGSTHVYQNAPDDITPEAVQARAEKEFGKGVQGLDGGRKASKTDMLKDELVTSIPGRMLRGAKDVIDTGAELLASGYDKLTGASEGARVKAMNDAGEADYAAARGRVGQEGADLARIGGQIVATAPVGPVLGAGAKAAGMNRLAQALASGGFRTGATVAPTAGARLADMGIRMAGGAGTGAVSAGLIDPEATGAGAAVGALLPPVAKIAGAAGSAIGSRIRGPQVPQNVLQGVQAARSAGYVIPPSQAKPTLVNRLTEGLAGKITTAQNASVRNQQVTNELAKSAIGVKELTPDAIAAVRSAANQAYDDLANVGAFQADDAYRAAISKAAGSKTLPGIANKEVDDLVTALGSQGTLDAQQTIESIKRLRFEGSANKGAQDPVKKALGSAQMKIAGALEDLIDRNLKASGRPELLESYRNARTTLAKVYDVEKAMTAAGNVDAKKLAGLLKKGRPLTGELRTIAEFADQFPKAAQTLEGMGSLPQSSPLDWTAATGLSLATSNPLLMATVAARPLARSAALSPMVQNRLATPASQNALARLLVDQTAPLAYRATPALAADR